jgi:prophage regulatory protein
MQQKEKIQIIRAKDVYRQIGISRSAFYKKIQSGDLPTGISLGDRSVGWVEDEIETVLMAMISGKTEKEIKVLVIQIIKNRQTLI